MSMLLQAELRWVAEHPTYYEGPWHQRAVQGNIKKRYQLQDIKRQQQDIVRRLLIIRTEVDALIKRADETIG